MPNSVLKDDGKSRVRKRKTPLQLKAGSIPLMLNR